MSVFSVRVLGLLMVIGSWIAVQPSMGQEGDFEVLDYRSDTIAVSCPLEGTVRLKVTVRRLSPSLTQLFVDAPTEPAFTSGETLLSEYSFGSSETIDLFLTFSPRTPGTFVDSLRLFTAQTSRTLRLIGRGYGNKARPSTLYFLEGHISVPRDARWQQRDTFATLVNGGTARLVIDTVHFDHPTDGSLISPGLQQILEGGDTTRIHVVLDNAELDGLGVITLLATAHNEADSSVVRSLCSISLAATAGTQGSVSILPDPIVAHFVDSNSELRATSMVVFNGTSDTIQVSDAFASDASVEVEPLPLASDLPALAPGRSASFAVRWSTPRCEPSLDKITVVHHPVGQPSIVQSTQAALIGPPDSIQQLDFRLALPPADIGSIVPLAVVASGYGGFLGDSVFITVVYDASSAVPYTWDKVVADSITEQDRRTTFAFELPSGEESDTVLLGSMIMTLGRTAELTLKTEDVRLRSPLQDMAACVSYSLDTISVTIGGVRGREVDPTANASIVRLFPNPLPPSYGTLTVVYQGNQPPLAIRIVDQLGLNVDHVRVSLPYRSETYVTELAAMASGSYFVHVITPTGTTTRLLIVQ